MPADLHLDPANFVQELFPEGVAVTRDQIEQCPSAKGAYAILIHLSHPVEVKFGRSHATVGSGWHAYAGSALGPGGTKGRLRRHLAPDKKLHWHVDQITTRASKLIAFAIKGGSECDIVARLSRSGRFSSGPEGFGSSDCRTCKAHLLTWRDTA